MVHTGVACHPKRTNVAYVNDMLPMEILQLCADYLLCDIVERPNGYELVLKRMSCFEIITDLDGNPMVVPCVSM